MASSDPKHGDRWQVRFDKYAEVRIPDVREGWRNPIRYTTLKELGIELDGIEFEAMPLPQPSTARVDDVQPMSIEKAKQSLAAAFGVEPDAIEITIRG